MKKIFLIVFLIFAVSVFAQNPVTLKNIAGAWEAGGMTATDLYGMGLPRIGGTWYYVDFASGNDNWDGLTDGTAVKSLTTAYGKCTSGRGDGIVLISRTIAGTSYSDTLTGRITWSKYGITVVGLASGNGYFGRARVTHSSDGDSLAALLLVSGQNNRFYNINFYNSPDNDGDPVGSTAKVSAVQISGARNAFINCHFNCSPQTANAYKSDLELRAGSDECTFDQCFFGSSSYDAGDNAACWIHLMGAAAQHFYRDCIFLQQVSAGTAFGAYETSGATVLNGLDIFKECIFGVWRANTHADICASWFIGTKPNTGNIVLANCVTGGFTALDSVGGNDTVWTNQPASNSAGGITVAP